MTSALIIRPATVGDRDQIWAVLKPVFRAGDTYAIDPLISRRTALEYWCSASRSVWVAIKDAQVVGSYYLCANQSGGGKHVCNCGFVTSPQAQGQGVARTMLDHALHTFLTFELMMPRTAESKSAFAARSSAITVCH